MYAYYCLLLPQWPSFSFSKRKSEKSPLSKLKPQELESLGLKAVGEGADPGELQDAFAKAQVRLYEVEYINLVLYI